MCISAAMGSDRAQLQDARGPEPGEGPGFTGSDVVIINRLFRNTGREEAFACRRGRVLDERALAGLVRVPWFRWGFTRRFVSVIMVLRAVSVGADGEGADGIMWGVTSQH